MITNPSSTKDKAHIVDINSHNTHINNEEPTEPDSWMIPTGEINIPVPIIVPTTIDIPAHKDNVLSSSTRPPLETDFCDIDREGVIG